MKITHYKIAVLVLMLFAGTATFAQEEKKKPLASAESERELIIRKQKKVDSLHEKRLYGKRYQVDSTRDKQFYIRKHRVDSTYEKQLLIKKFRADSGRYEKPRRIQKHRVDSANYTREVKIRKYERDSSRHRYPAKNIRSRKIQVSLACNPDATVFLENIMHRVNIIATNDDKVTLVAKVLYQGGSTLTDSEWLSKLKLSLSGDEKEIEVKSEDLSLATASDGRKLDSIFNGVPVFDSLGAVIGARTQDDRNFILYLPKGAKVDIDSKYADITFQNNAGKVKVNIVNGVLNLMDADELLSNSSYARIYAGKIGHAEVEVNNGRFNAKGIGTLRISSSNSSVDVARVDQLYITNSQADQYRIEEARHISGKKAFGSLQLTALAGSVDLSGKNADVEIKRIDPSASGVNITTQYANLLLPTNNLKNYTVAFEGRGDRVRAPFAKRAVTANSFKASVGDKYKKLTEFRLNCQDCTVDFN